MLYTTTTKKHGIKCLDNKFCSEYPLFGGVVSLLIRRKVNFVNFLFLN